MVLLRWKALLLCLVPGFAQLYVRHFWRAVFFFFVWMYGINAVALGLLWPPDRMIAGAFIWSGIPMALLGWIFAFMDAWNATKKRETGDV